MSPRSMESHSTCGTIISLANMLHDLSEVDVEMLARFLPDLSNLH